MTAGRFSTATLVGGLTLFLVGFLLWGLAFAGIMEAHHAAGTFKEPPDLLLLALSQFAWAALLTVILGSWARVTGFGSALRVGAIVGLLAGLSVDLSIYATSHIMDLTVVALDPLIWAVWSGIGAGVIGVMLERGQGSA